MPAIFMPRFHPHSMRASEKWWPSAATDSTGAAHCTLRTASASSGRCAKGGSPTASSTCVPRAAILTRSGLLQGRGKGRV